MCITQYMYYVSGSNVDFKQKKNKKEFKRKLAPMNALRRDRFDSGKG